MLNLSIANISYIIPFLNLNYLKINKKFIFVGKSFVVVDCITKCTFYYAITKYHIERKFGRFHHSRRNNLVWWKTSWIGWYTILNTWNIKPSSGGFKTYILCSLCVVVVLVNIYIFYNTTTYFIHMWSVMYNMIKRVSIFCWNLYEVQGSSSWRLYNSKKETSLQQIKY